MVQIKLPDGSVKEYPEGVRPREVAEGIGKRLAEAAVAAVADGTVVDLDRPLEDGTDAPIELRILTPRDREALDVLRHSTAHIMARAIMRLFPGRPARLRPDHRERLLLRRRLPGRSLSEDDFPAIEAEMAKIVKDAEPFERFSLPVAEARQFVADLGQTLQGRAHRRRAAQVRRPQLLPPGRVRRPLPRPAHPPRRQGRRVQAALDRRAPTGRATDRKMLQRVYGTAFFDKKDLDAYLAQVEEAKKRDHRMLGKELSLFTISPLVGPGLILWMPKGAIVRGILENFIKDELLKRGYQPVYTPHIGKLELYQTSGHYPVLQGLAVPDPAGCSTDAAPWSCSTAWRTATLDDDAQKILLGQGGHPRAACPTRPTTDDGQPGRGDADSYFELEHGRADRLRRAARRERGIPAQADELPAPHPDLRGRSRAATATCRCGWPSSAPSTATSSRASCRGMTRVRGFTQDDAHLFCTHEQVRGEFRATMELTQFVLEHAWA